MQEPLALITPECPRALVQLPLRLPLGDRILTLIGVHQIFTFMVSTTDELKFRVHKWKLPQLAKDLSLSEDVCAP